MRTKTRGGTKGETYRTKQKVSGKKTYLITGEWNMQGHCLPFEHKIYTAGKAGKMEEKIGSTKLLDSLTPFAQKASECLTKHRPEVAAVIGNLSFQLGKFHLFMYPQGGSGFHRDPNDYISFVFVIGDDGEVGSSSSPSKSSSASGDGGGRHARKSSRLGFETHISAHLQQEAERNAERHKEKMLLFEKLLDKL